MVLRVRSVSFCRSARMSGRIAGRPASTCCFVATSVASSPERLCWMSAILIVILGASIAGASRSAATASATRASESRETR